MCFWVTEKRVDYCWDVPIDLSGNDHIWREGGAFKGLFSKSKRGIKLLIRGKKKSRKKILSHHFNPPRLSTQETLIKCSFMGNEILAFL